MIHVDRRFSYSSSEISQRACSLDNSSEYSSSIICSRHFICENISILIFYKKASLFTNVCPEWSIELFSSQLAFSIRCISSSVKRKKPWISFMIYVAHSKCNHIIHPLFISFLFRTSLFFGVKFSHNYKLLVIVIKYFYVLSLALGLVWLLVCLRMVNRLILLPIFYILIIFVLICQMSGE